ncbi:MAG TPA: ATP-binding protein [Vicinamibacterales bacterium]|nr:ATP-binding protein [Vicinamibacterales bacterium]
MFDVTDNPFVYGEVVPAAAFVDRTVELDRLVRDLHAAQKVFLISPRRYGKSSLIRHALSALRRRGTLTVDVTVSSFSSYVAFLEGYARALMTAETAWERARSWLREAIRSARAEIRYAPDPALRTPGSGTVSVSFPGVRSDRDVARLAEEVFALPGRLAETRSRRIVIALDEFQAIGGFNGGSVEHALRAAVQHQRSVGYVFAGSEPSLMERMLGARRPFYKAGPVMRLDKIPADEFAAFIDRRFRRSGMRPEEGLGAAIVELAGNLPYDVQRLAHETWDEVRAQRGRRRATLDDLHRALKRLLIEQQAIFEALWERLTLAQRAVLRAVVVEDGREMLSADVRARFRLGGPSTVQAALGALVRDDMVVRDGSRYAVVDSLFREWVARQTF